MFLSGAEYSGTPAPARAGEGDWACCKRQAATDGAAPQRGIPRRGGFNLRVRMGSLTAVSMPHTLHGHSRRIERTSNLTSDVPLGDVGRDPLHAMEPA